MAARSKNSYTPKLLREKANKTLKSKSYEYRNKVQHWRQGYLP